MSTLQKQIRDLVLTKVQATTGFTDANSYRAPRRDIPAVDLPALLIYSHNDRPIDADVDQRFPHERAYTLRVELRVKERVEDDATDLLASQVRRALLTTDDTLGGLVMRTIWDQQQWDGVENDIPESGTALDFTFHYVFQPE
jgi:hypothetical protein